MSSTLREQLSYEVFIQLYVKENRSLAHIGELYGVSRQRVHQMKQEFEKEYGKISRKKTIDLFTLKRHLDQNFSIREIADKHRLTPNQVMRQIKMYQKQYEKGILPVGIKINKAEDLLSREELMRLYLDDLLTDDEIGKLKRLSPSSVSLLRKQYGIPTIFSKSLRKLPKKLPKEKFEQLYINQQYTLEEMAKKFKCSVNSMIKLKEFYEIAK